jgi:hypothetical protein
MNDLALQGEYNGENDLIVKLMKSNKEMESKDAVLELLIPFLLPI